MHANTISETFACVGKRFCSFLSLPMFVGKTGNVIFERYSSAFVVENFVDKLIDVRAVLFIETVLQVFPNIDREISVWDCQKNLSVNVVHEKV